MNNYKFKNNNCFVLHDKNPDFEECHLKNQKYIHLRDGIFIGENANDYQIAEVFDFLHKEYNSYYIDIDYNRSIYKTLLDIAFDINSSYENVLDFGCGSGIGFENLNNRFNKSQIFGFDVSHNMLRLSAEAGYKTLKSYSEYSINVKSNTFELIIGVFILGLLQSDKWIKEFKRVIRHDGILIFNIYAPKLDWRTHYSTMFEQCGFEVMLLNEYNFKYKDKERIMPILVAKKTSHNTAYKTLRRKC